MLGLHPGRILELSVRALTCIMVGMGVGVEINVGGGDVRLVGGVGGTDER